MEDFNQTVAGVTMEECDGACISVLRNADSASITANQISRCATHGILSETPGRILISGNHVRSCARAGIQLTGSNATVVDNYVAETGYSCIESDSSGAVFEENNLIDCHEDGIAIRETFGIYDNHSAVNNQIKRNVISWCGGYGVRIHNGDHNVASENILKGTGVLVHGHGNLIEGNELDHTPGQGSGIEVLGKHNAVENNLVSNVGGTCISIQFAENTVRHNDLKNCGVDGIAVNADLNTLTGNNVTDCGNDGIDIMGGNYNLISRNNVKLASAVAFHDATGSNDWNQPVAPERGRFLRAQLHWK